MCLNQSCKRRRSPRINRNKFFNDDKRFEDEDSHKLSDSEILLNRLKREFRPPKVLFENEKVIVIDKPSGCALQAEEASEPFYRWQLIYNHFESFNGSKLYLVHRLDKSTSGPLILAKSSTVARTISNQFQNSKILKKYLALVQFDRSKKGPIHDARGSGRIDCRVRNRNDRMVIAEAKREGSDCKRAITDWHIVTATSTHAIVGLRPKTGRKHQLRLHCSRFLSSPIVGDFKYDFEYLNDKSKKAIEGFLKRESSSRIMLHCSEIEFKLYRKIEPKEYTVNVRSEIPEDFRILCDQVDLSTESLRR
ncbi:pseudouridine synthase [Phakopsora pachyrhizi]|nr:pseudouridine synthase [Phakopsora pachyrhizi]